MNTPTRIGWQPIQLAKLGTFFRFLDRFSKVIGSQIRLAKLGTPSSHLFFTDDLLLLLKAYSQLVVVINKVMGEFCASLGANVNKSKTLVYFSANISAMEASRIGSELGASVTDNLGKYLGVLLLHNQISKQTY